MLLLSVCAFFLIEISFEHCYLMDLMWFLIWFGKWENDVISNILIYAESEHGNVVHSIVK